MEIAELLAKTSEWAWPFTIFLLGIIFRGPVSKSLGRINEIEVKGVKLKLSQIEAVMDERERLKTSIAVATADRENESPEVKALRNIAASMPPALIGQDNESVERILRFSYDLAMEDGEFSDKEREALVKIAKMYDWREENTKDLLEKWIKQKS